MYSYPLFGLVDESAKIAEYASASIVVNPVSTAVSQKYKVKYF